MTVNDRLLNILEACYLCGPRASIDDVAHKGRVAPSAAGNTLKILAATGLIEHRRMKLCDKWIAKTPPHETSGPLKMRVWQAIKRREKVYGQDIAAEFGVAGTRVTEVVRELSRCGCIVASTNCRQTHTRHLTHSGIEALIEAGRITSDAITKPKRKSDPVADQRDRLIRIGQQDRIALRRVLQAQFRLPYREVEATMQRLGFGGVGA